MTFYRNEETSPLCTIDLKYDKGNIRNKNCLRKITKLDKHKGKRKTEFISLHYTSVFNKTIVYQLPTINRYVKFLETWIVYLVHGMGGHKDWYSPLKKSFLQAW